MSEKEKGEESKFFKAEEAKKLAEIKANLEKIMAGENTEQKEELIQMLSEPKAEDKGIIGKLGLDDWKIALPVGIFIAIPTLANEVLVLSPESQLVACFMIFCGTMYNQIGGPVGKYLDNVADEKWDKVKKFDDNILKEVLDGIKENQQVKLIYIFLKL